MCVTICINKNIEVQRLIDEFMIEVQVQRVIDGVMMEVQVHRLRDDFTIEAHRFILPKSKLFVSYSQFI